MLFFNIMLITRALKQAGFIFSNNVDPKYLKLLVDLGSVPFVIKVQSGKRIPIILVNKPIMVANRIPYMFEYDPCSIRDIKNIIQIIIAKYLKVKKQVASFDNVLEDLTLFRSFIVSIFNRELI